MRNSQISTYKHLTLDERVTIYTLKQQEVSLQDIAKILSRNVGTISREPERNKSRCDMPYFPTQAHQNAIKRGIKQRTKAPLKNHETYLYVRKKLKEDEWSPQLISGRIKIEKPHLSICTETIYQYIHGKGKKYKLWRFLDQRHKKRRVKSGRRIHKEKQHSRIPNAVSIDKRPTKANNRTQVGHFETDLMEGPRSTKAALSVTVDRKSRYIIISKVQNKKAKNKEKVLTFQLKSLQSLQKSNNPIVRSMTTDNGSENTNHKQVSEALNIKYFFCHPYHSWEKGSVENTNKRIRRYIPKGTSIQKLSNDQIQWIENRLNNRPMKCLNYQTPNEAMEQECNSYKFRRFKSSKETSVALQLRM